MAFGKLQSTFGRILMSLFWDVIELEVYEGFETKKLSSHLDQLSCWYHAFSNDHHQVFLANIVQLSSNVTFICTRFECVIKCFVSFLYLGGGFFFFLI